VAVSWKLWVMRAVVSASANPTAPVTIEDPPGPVCVVVGATVVPGEATGQL
jgi:hypothetical protein